MDKKVAICGEIAGNRLALPFILGAGIYDLSTSPEFIPQIKNIIQYFSIN